MAIFLKMPYISFCDNQVFFKFFNDPAYLHPIQD